MDQEDISLTKVRISIGAKLVAIITIIVLISLGSITALVSWLVSSDLQNAAEATNSEVNRRSAMEAEFFISSFRSNSLTLIQALTAFENRGNLAEQTVEVFFGQNPRIAALLFTTGSRAAEFYTNKRYFLLRGADAELASSFPEDFSLAMRRASLGETLIENVTPLFGMNLLALFFPIQNGSGCVLFSPENLNDSFGFGTNQSYLINDRGDILVHSDYELILNGANIGDGEFTRMVWDRSENNLQTLYSDEEGVRYFGAFTRLTTGGCSVITSIEYDKVFEQLAATTRRNIYLSIAVLSISILIIWFFSKSISLPLRALAAASQTIESGSFDIQLKPKGHDEVGLLTSSFQRMCSALGIFGKFTNRDIAVRAMRGEIKPGGLPKHATIFFSDIREFTSESEKMTMEFGKEAPDRIVHWLNNYLSRMVECVEKTGGVVDKFIGDAVMAHWGTAFTTGSPEKDAFNCIRAALLMRKALYDMNKNRNPQDKSDPPINIGCGINTGIVTAGQIGSDLRMEYTVIGDPVNLASRIESLNKALGTDILITEHTWHLVKNYFVTEEMPPVKVKGKDKPVRIFAVINFASVDKGPKTLKDVQRLLGITVQDNAQENNNQLDQKFIFPNDEPEQV